MKQLLTIMGLSFCLFSAIAQEEHLGQIEEATYSVLSQDSLSIEIGFIPESLDANLDSLLQSWHVQYFSQVQDYCHDDEENVVFSDSTYKARLMSLPNIIPIQYNNIVRNSIDLYAERRRPLVRYMLGMADYYFPIIEQVLDEHDMPLELKYLAVVESALNPKALSRVGASGLWQFMLPTAKAYGLTINSLVDERFDPVKSTEAACRYLKSMYEIYGDWNLVLAAYNCGPGNVNKALRRSGGKTDFWEIYPHLPRETRSYVPLFFAANYIMTYHCEHNICPIQTSLPLATDTIMVNKMLHLQQVADVLSMDIEDIRALNPQYKRDIIPGNSGAAILKLPATQAYAFVDKEDTVYTHNAAELLANIIPLNADGKPESSTRERITHRTVRGETLYTIANTHGVTARDIRKWNGLGSNRIAAGRNLILFVDNGGVMIASNKNANNKPQEEVTITTSDGSYISYRVQSGDSLYTISRRYPGVTASKIQDVNGLKGTMIRPGQVLKIPVI